MTVEEVLKQFQGISFTSTELRRRFKLPDPVYCEDWCEADFLKFDLISIRNYLNKIGFYG